MQCCITLGLASVPSVSVWLRSKKRPWNGSFGFDRARNLNENQKKKEGGGGGGGGGEGRKPACGQTPRFRKPAFASECSAWLAWLVEQYWRVSIKGLFHTERSCQGRQDLPYKARAFSLTSFETQSSSCDCIRVSGRLIYSPVSWIWKRFSFVRECDGLLQCFVTLGPGHYCFFFFFAGC